MRILFVGDVVGRAGRTAIAEYLPGMIRDWSLDLVVVNGENSAGGFGITEAIYQEFLDAGADAVTLGNHAWDQREALVFIERAPKPGPPGELSARHAGPRRGAGRHQERQARAGRQRHRPRLHDAVRRSLRRARPRTRSLSAARGGRCDRGRFPRRGDAARSRASAIFCDGRASLVVGTHTHVPTADHQILAGGTAYMTDAGMTGDYDSIIGMQKEEPLRRFTTGIPSGRFEPAAGVATLSRRRGRDR